ncbi:MAG: ABC transporter permease [Gemmatimonadetes bacterium]|nr:ABC transporter permease [Gemmatimonadota bacterium]MCC7131172.1 ABC transporter permease [Gemmatimonadales bacterium]
MTFEWFVALRFLREGRTQTALILTGVCVGVGTIVFLSALINGLQDNIIARTLGNQAHIVVRPPEELPRIVDSGGTDLLDARVIRPPQRIRPIQQWQQVAATIRRAAGVTAVVPTVNGPAFALRGNGTKAVAVRGLDPAEYSAIVDLGPKLVAGTLELTGFQAIVGLDLARSLGLVVGDKIRLLVGSGTTAIYTVVGTIDLGIKDLNERWVLIPLRAAQTLFGLEGGVSTLEVKVDRIFEAEPVAAVLSQQTGLDAESWMKTNSQLLVGLRSQSSSSIMIQTFVILAVALGIASVLAVSVVQKAREIGIMMAFGTARAKVLRIFLIQGGLVGLIGSLGGVAMGLGLGLFFESLATNPDGTPTFPVVLRYGLYARAAGVATITGLLAAVLPARRASRLDPAVTIRNG